MSVFKGNLAEQTVFIRIERSRPEAIDGIIVRNDPVNFTDPLGLWSVSVGGAFGGADISSKIYDSDKGWFPSTSPDLGASTTLVGGGFQVQLGNDDPGKVYVGMGLGKYLGFDIAPGPNGLGGHINLGLSLGSPVSISTSLENFAQGTGEAIGNFVRHYLPDKSDCGK